MKTSFRKSLVLLAAIALVCCAIPVHAEGPSRVLLIAREKSEDMEFWLTREVAVFIKLLNEAGYEVLVADQSGDPIIAGKSRLHVDLRLADAQIDDFAGIIVPCIGAGYMPGNAPEAGVSLLIRADAAGKPIAAQHSDEMLRPAGLYMKRKVAVGPGAVRDGNLITSYNCPYNANANGKPEDAPMLIARFVEALRGD
jgi:hypothetical protein